MKFACTAAVCLTIWGASVTFAADAPVVGNSFQAQDSLRIDGHASEDEQLCLEGLAWPPTEFSVDITAGRGREDFLVRFPSACPSGDERVDRVAMEWYARRDETGQLIEAPAIVVVHEIGSNMAFGRLMAKGLNTRGFHTFLVHLPSYGERRIPERARWYGSLFAAMKQGIADVRRARDAVAVLPGVDARCIALQGTSFGGFVASLAGALDQRFDAVFLTMSGGDLYSILQEGQRDAAKVRDGLKKSGLTDDELKSLAYQVEPNRLAHRLNPSLTWVYSGLYDTVVPPACTLSLVRAAGLNPRHHVCMPADHYLGALYLPIILNHMSEQIEILRAPIQQSALIPAIE